MFLLPDGYIMNDKEIEIKTRMWVKVNADYLKEKAEKEEKGPILRNYFSAENFSSDEFSSSNLGPIYTQKEHL
jgi:hypothetical protein